MRDFVAATQYGIQLLKRDDVVVVAAAVFVPLVTDFCLVPLLMLFDLAEHFRITGVLCTDCHWSASFKHLRLRCSNRLFRLKFNQRYNAVCSIALRCLPFTPRFAGWAPFDWNRSSNRSN